MKTMETWAAAATGFNFGQDNVLGKWQRGLEMPATALTNKEHGFDLTFQPVLCDPS